MISLFNWVIESNLGSKRLLNTRESVVACGRDRDTETRICFVIPICNAVIVEDKKAFLREQGSNVLRCKKITARFDTFHSEYRTFYRCELKERIISTHQKLYHTGLSLHMILFNLLRVPVNGVVNLETLDMKPWKKGVYIIETESHIKRFCSSISEYQDFKPYLLAFDIECFTVGEIDPCDPRKAVTHISWIYSASKKQVAYTLEILQELSDSWDDSEKIQIEDSIRIIINCYKKSYRKHDQDYQRHVAVKIHARTQLKPPRILVTCENEATLLYVFKILIEKTPIEHITGHNIVGFDLAYINKRIKFIHSDNELMIKLATCRLFEPRLIETKKMVAKGSSYSVPIYTGCMVVLDFLSYSKREIKANSHALDFCSMSNLTWRSKVIEKTSTGIIVTMPPRGMLTDLLGTGRDLYMKLLKEKFRYELVLTGLMIIMSSSIDIACGQLLELAHCKVDISLKNLYKDYTKDAHDIVSEYCLHDSALSMGLYMKEMMDVRINAFADVFQLSQGDVMNYANNKRATSQILQAIEDSKIIIRPSKSEKEKFKAARVKEPDEKYLTKPVGVLDVSSMYPNIFEETNCSREQVVELKKYKYKYDCLIAREQLRKVYPYPEYIIFISERSVKETTQEYTLIVLSQVEKGYLPSMLHKFIERRNLIKRQIKELGAFLKILQNCQTIEDIKKAPKPTEYVQEALKLDSCLDTLEELMLKIEGLLGYLDKIQLAYKLAANSIFGLIGSTTFVFNAKELAQTCCAVGYAIAAYLEDAADATLTVIVNLNQMKIQDYSVTWHRSLIHPISDQPVDVAQLKKDLDIEKYPDCIMVSFKLNSAYGDTDSIFVKFTAIDLKASETQKLLCVENGLIKRFGVYKPILAHNSKPMLKIVRISLSLFREIINKYVLFGKIQVEDEKVLTYLFIQKKGWHAYSYPTVDSVDQEPRLVYSGTSMNQRTKCQWHKNIMNSVDLLHTDLQSKGFHMARIVVEIIKLITNKLNQVQKDIVTEQVDLGLFMGSGCFRETKNKNYTPYKKVKEYNKQIAKGYIDDTELQLGDRYFYVYVIDDLSLNQTARKTGEPIAWQPDIKKKLESMEIVNPHAPLILGKRLWFEAYVKILVRELVRRYDNTVEVIMDVFNKV